jgi:hypothetical protein
MLIQAGLLVWYTSLSSVDEVSRTLTWFSIALLVSGLTDLGFGTMITKFGSQSKHTQRAILALDTVITFLLLSLVAGLSLIVILFLPTNLSIEIVLIPALLLCWSLMETLVEAGALTLVSQAKSFSAGIVVVVRRFAGLILFPMLLTYFSPGLSFALALFGGTLATYFFVPKAIDFRKSRVHVPHWREISKFALNSAWGQLRNLEGPIVTALFSPLISSSFLLASRLASPISIITGSFGTVIVGADRTIRPSTVRLIVLSLIAIAGFFVSCLDWISKASLPIFSTVIPWVDEQSLVILGLVLLRFLIVGVGVGIFSSMMIRFGDISKSSRANMFANLVGVASLLIVGILLNDIYIALLTAIFLGLLQVALVGRQLVNKAKRLDGLSN